MRIVVFDYLTHATDRHFKNVLVLRRADPARTEGWDYRLLPVDNSPIGDPGGTIEDFEAWAESSFGGRSWLNTARQTLNDYGESAAMLREILDRFRAVDLDAILSEMLRESGGASRIFEDTESVARVIRRRLQILEDSFETAALRFSQGNP
jgi:hypothetical protein